MNFSKARVTKFNSTKRKGLFDDHTVTPGPGRYSKIENNNNKKGLK